MTIPFSILLGFTLIATTVFAQKNSDTLYAFVGKKVSIKKAKQPEFKADKIPFYTKYKCRFKVVQPVYNQLQEKTVTFYSYAHLGTRELPTSEYSLLFLVRRNKQLNLIRFQYFDVYQTRDGRWASLGDPFYNAEQYRDSVKTPIHATALDFKNPVVFKISSNSDSARVKEAFPAPYFKIEGQIVTGLMGCYVEDLFIVQKEGILKKLGYFK